MRAVDAPAQRPSDRNGQRRRKFAQKKVAEQREKKLSAVQGKVRDVYDAKAGRKSAQELFEEGLEAIEQAYQSHLHAQ